MNWRKALRIAVLAMIPVGSIGYLYFRIDLAESLPIKIQHEQIIDVRPGDTWSTVIQELARKGWIDDPWAVRWKVRLQRQSPRIQVGEYLLKPIITIAELREQLTRGEVIHYQVTLIEGWTWSQALTAIQQSHHVLSTMTVADGAEIAAELGIAAESPEGWFFPDTYNYTRGTTDRNILKRSHQRLVEILSEEWGTRVEELPLDTMTEALTLASIIEKETGRPDEREMIASVFMNRLAAGMRLQSDPTVIYGIGERFDGNLRRKDLETETPYNTYRISGLPPGPIALPGRASIYAALHPATSNNFYFVGRGDGSHQFSQTLEDHNDAVRTFQLGRQ